MILKPREHEIDEAGEQLLRNALRQLGWAVSKVERDYGIDFNVQIFQDRSPTGDWFHVQLKSSANSNYSQARTFISQNLDSDHAEHYAMQAKHPLLLIHADVISGKLFWCSPQLDRSLKDPHIYLDKKTVTVRISTDNELPVQAPKLLAEIGEIHWVLANRRISSQSFKPFTDSLKYENDLDKLRIDYQQHSDVLKFEKIVRLCREQQFNEARNRTFLIITDLDSSENTKFSAWLQLRSIDFSMAHTPDAIEGQLSKIMFEHAQKMCSAYKSGPRRYRFFSIIIRKAAEFSVLASEDSMLFMALGQHLEGGGNALAAISLYARRSHLNKLISKKYGECVRLTNYVLRDKDRYFLARALLEIVNSLAPYSITARAEKRIELVSKIERQTLQLVQLCSQLLGDSNDEEGVGLAIISALTTVHSEDSEAFKWAKQRASEIREDATRKDAEELIEREIRRWKGLHNDEDVKGNVEWQIIRKLAHAQGLDTSDEKSVFVRLLRIAALDNSPERVIKTCEHIIVSQGALGPLARMIEHRLNIGTAGGKAIHCTLHDYHCEGKQLDSAYAEFKQRYCDNCPDVHPRSIEWRYEGSVREELEQKNLPFVKRFVGRPFGLRFTVED